MKQDVANEWANKLDSGKYKQGRNALNRDGFFCCLGVLCELAVEKGVIPPAVQKSDGGMYYLESDAVLPKEVAAWAGIQYESGMFLGGEYEESYLTAMNDMQGYTFPLLARIIRENARYL